MAVTAALLGIIITIASLALYFIWDSMNYWKKRGIPHDKPCFLHGNLKGVTRTHHMKEILHDLYDKFKGSGPFCGVYFFTKPAALILDLQLLKKILIKDFNSFVDRGVYYNESDDPLSAHLFAVDGGKWRNLRNKLSPTFSSRKMKFMFPTVAEVGQRFVQAFDKFVNESGPIVEIKEINARFTTDVIGTCVFGIKCNSLTDPNSQLRHYGRKVFAEGRHHPIVLQFAKSCPNLARKLGIQLTPDDVETFFMSAVRDTIAFREKNQIRGSDFMDHFIDLINKKPVKTVDGENLTSLTLEEVAAQAYAFYLGGFETSSSTLSYALYELAINTEVQDKLRTEVNDVLDNHNGAPTYECISEMPYMGQVIEETLRKYSVIPTLQRIAKQDYDTGDPKYKIEKGTLVLIPSEAIHYDPEIYPNPMQFNPDRFTPDEKKKRESVAYLAFGEGPRNCIGLRFGKMQTQIGLTLLIKNFKFSACDRTQIPLKFDVTQPQQILVTADGIYVNATKI